MKRIILVTCLLSLAGCQSNIENTVKITNLAGNSGGSGTVISLEGEEEGSSILTNAHVCEVVKKGGLVSTDAASAFVASYKVSAVHDLCLIKVLTNLSEGSLVASTAPHMFDTSVVYGHPHLLPTIISEGKFSGKMIIPVVTGSRACTEEEAHSPDTGLLCLFAGGLPIIRNYETIVTSSLIMPGSSGSGTYGAGKTVQAVIFAGRGDLGFGFAVPHEYVVHFLNNELSNLTTKLPYTETSASGESSKVNPFSLEKVKRLCALPKNKNNKICAQFRYASQYNDMIYKSKQ